MWTPTATCSRPGQDVSGQLARISVEEPNPGGTGPEKADSTQVAGNATAH